MADDSRPLSRRLRFEVLRRDGHRCYYCGASAPDVRLTVDHVLPVALGGSSDPSNLVAACEDCNSGKASTSPDEQTVAEVDQLALVFAQAMERAAVIRRAELDASDQLADAFRTIWRSDAIPMESGWEDSISRFVAMGLSLDDLERYVCVAMNNRNVPHKLVWRYFCGCCWQEIKRRQELARELMTAGAV